LKHLSLVDTSSLLTNHNWGWDYFNNATTNKLFHGIISMYMAKPVLEGADSFNKILITETKWCYLKVLQAKGMVMLKEALDYVATTNRSIYRCFNYSKLITKGQ
jgi:hypothetical protein